MEQQSLKPERCGICAKTGGLVLAVVGGITKMVRCQHGKEIIERYDDYQERRVGE